MSIPESKAGYVWLAAVGGCRLLRKGEGRGCCTQNLLKSKNAQEMFSLSEQRKGLKLGKI
jgi:hypothetical protein